jgi:hypothetical protein
MNKHSHKIYLFVITFLVLTTALPAFLLAQQPKVKNQEKYDRQRLHFGFLLGVNNTDFRVTRADDFYKSDSVLVLEPDGQGGFNLGIVTDLKLAENFDLRFVPDLAFSQRNLNYKIQSAGKKTETIIKQVESTFIEFPLEIKFKSNRINNYRIYVLGGYKYMIDMVSQAKVSNDQQLVKLKKQDHGYFIGFGMDFYLPLFKFSPEIKMFQGVPDVLQMDPTAYSTSIKSLRSRIFTLSFIFE